MEPSERSDEPAAQPEFVLRGGQDADLDFVRDSWRRNYDYAPCPGGVPEYIATQSQFIETCLRSSEVVIACPPARHEQILGWVCARERDVVHYVYVKPYYRRHGIAKALLGVVLRTGTRAIYITHRWQRPHAEGIGAIVTGWQRAGGVVNYNPALIYGPQRQEWMPR